MSNDSHSARAPSRMLSNIMDPDKPMWCTRCFSVICTCQVLLCKGMSSWRNTVDGSALQRIFCTRKLVVFSKKLVTIVRVGFKEIAVGQSCKIVSALQPRVWPGGKMACSMKSQHSNASTLSKPRLQHFRNKMKSLNWEQVASRLAIHLLRTYGLLTSITPVIAISSS